MIYENLMFHNVGDMKKTSLGLRISRFPQNVSTKMGQYGNFISRYGCGCEIRFVTDANIVLITLHADVANSSIIVYNGDYVNSNHIIEQDKTVTIKLEFPTHFYDVSEEFYENNVFSKDVWRIHLHGAHFTYCDINAMGYPIRVPTESELPQKTMICYGSSITHGAGATNHNCSYIHQTARLLGVDVLNKGLGGSCFLENGVADYIASEKWNFALLELGVNMINDYTVEEFKNRATYFLKEVISKNPQKYIFLITIFPNSYFYLNGKKEQYDCVKFNDALREIYESINSEYFVLIDGQKVLTHTEYLTSDLIHPSTEGHMMMGINLAKILSEYVK